MENTSRITKKQLEGMLKRVRGNSGLNLSVGRAYGNQYTLELNSNKHTGVSDVVHAVGIREMYDSLYAIARTLEAMKTAKPDELIAEYEA